MLYVVWNKSEGACLCFIFIFLFIPGKTDRFFEFHSVQRQETDENIYQQHLSVCEESLSVLY